jgi:hypothetical protein
MKKMNSTPAMHRIDEMEFHSGRLDAYQGDHRQTVQSRICPHRHLRLVRGLTDDPLKGRSIERKLRFVMRMDTPAKLAYDSN